MLQKPENTMDDLLAKTSNLTVLDEDGWEINVAEGSVVGEHCTKAKFCSNRPMSRPLLKTILGRVWGIADKNWGVEIKVSNNKSSFLVFSFKSGQDLNRILNKSPWLLNYGTLILERMENLPCDWEKELLCFPISGRVLYLPSRSITQGNIDWASLSFGRQKDLDPFQKIYPPAVVDPDQGLGVPSASSSNPWKLLELSSGLALNDSERTSLNGKEVDGIREKMKGKSEAENFNYRLGTYNKVEGPLKRRRVTPKRLKNKGKEGQAEIKLMELAKEVRDYHPEMIFLSETQLTSCGMELVRVQLGFVGCFTVDAREKSGGLALLWSDDFKVQIKSFTVSHIDELVENDLGKAISDCQLREISSAGNSFTWCNGRASNLIYEKLDRVLCNSVWLDMFKFNKVTLLKWWNSDHRPMLLEAQQSGKRSLFRRNWGSRFHYEHAWADNDECLKIINEVWGDKVMGRPLDNLNHLLSKCGRRLYEWNIKQKKANFARSKELKEKIDWLSKSPNMMDWIARQKLEKDLNCVEEKREMYWRQRSRALWLKHGDQNTKFFHFKASARRKKNTILGLYDDRGHWRTSEKDLTDIAISYFQHLFSKSNGGTETKEALRGLFLGGLVLKRIVHYLSLFLVKKLSLPYFKSIL
uniref:DUF4283 domain-containing protein n=1 Tax=Cannabis sativa TaxID=3483 RepID=A0A803PQ16_CANSA